VDYALFMEYAAENNLIITISPSGKGWKRIFPLLKFSIASARKKILTIEYITATDT